MQQKALAFFHDFTASLTLYDYLGFALLGLFFLFFMILSIVVRQKPAAALLFAFLAFIMLIAGPFGVKEVFDRVVRSSAVVITKEQKLQYSKALLLEGKLTHTGKIAYSRCRVIIDIYKDRDNKYLNYLQRFLPFRSKTLHFDRSLQKGQNIAFETTIEEFAHEGEFNVRAHGECYP